MAIDHDKARRNMVDCQIRTSDVTNLDVLDAFLSVPREQFVPQELLQFAYLDEELALMDGRFLIAGVPLARLIQAASIQPSDSVLDVGCATGYSTAIISRLAKQVTGLECSPALASAARAALAATGCTNVVVVEGPLESGYAANAPYDVVFIGGSVARLPEALAGQLKNGGRLVVVEGTGNAAVARIYVNDDGVVSGRRLFNCSIPMLPGFERKPEFVF